MINEPLDKCRPSSTDTGSQDTVEELNTVTIKEEERKKSERLYIYRNYENTGKYKRN